MTSRREELNAYTFARKRLVAAFLQPSPARTDEGAPAALRAVLPGVVIAVVILAGFGAWGMFRPTAPKGWDATGQKVIVASESATLYVVLRTDGRRQLHPVLNMSSARLLLDPERFDVIKVDEKILDSGKLPHGPTVGIPYAPDRIPAEREAGRHKRWAVCQQQGQGEGAVQTATFLFADRDAGRVDGSERLRGGRMLYVRGPEPAGTRYLVDSKGVKRAVEGGDDTELLLRALVGDGEPQPVTQEWLDTLHDGAPIAFPRVPGEIGAPAGVEGLSPEADRIGTVLRARTGSGPQQYLVLKNKAVPVSDFVANLLLFSRQTDLLRQNNKPLEVNAQSFTPSASEERFLAAENWPEQAPQQANTLVAGEHRDTVCSVLRGVDSRGGTRLSTWAGEDFPAPTVDGGSSAYVTPGTGLLYRQIQGEDVRTGALFLVTDTGLRYGVQSNSDSSASDSGIGTDRTGDEPGADAAGGVDQADQADQVNEAQVRLGYRNVKPAPVPAVWSQFLPTGPRLDTRSARQPQGS